MRVISGSLKGRTIKGFNIVGTRPTMDRVKESVFGSIQDYIRDSVVLDLFAGSGNLGIEAISNGCGHCYFVDNNKTCIKCIRDNLESFGVMDKAILLSMDYKKALNFFFSEGISFDVIFIDPPYDYRNINDIVEIIDKGNILNKGGILVLEFRYDNVIVNDSIYSLHKNKKYGDKFVYIYKKIID